MTETQLNDSSQNDVGKIYSDIVYWSTISASLLIIISSSMALLGMTDVIEPVYLFNAIWAGESPADIWFHSLADMPDNDWYLEHLWYGDSLVMLGIAIGVFSVIPACITAGMIFLYNGQKFFGVMGILTGLLVLLPCLDLI